MTLLDVRVEKQPRQTLVEVTGDLDLATAEDLQRTLRGLADAPGDHTLVLDLRRLDFMDSTGLRLVLEASMYARVIGRSFTVLCAPGQPMRVIELAKLDDWPGFLCDSGSPA